MLLPLSIKHHVKPSDFFQKPAASIPEAISVPDNGDCTADPVVSFLIGHHTANLHLKDTNTFQYIRQDGHCYKHWVLPSPPEATPPSPENTWQATQKIACIKNSIHPVQTIFFPDCSNEDLDTVHKGLHELFPEPYPVDLSQQNNHSPDFSGWFLHEEVIWLKGDSENALIISPSLFPLLAQVSTTVENHWPELVAGAILKEPSEQTYIRRFTFTNDESTDDVLLNLLARLYGYVLSIRDRSGEIFYIVRGDSGSLYRISRAMVQLWFSQYYQSLLDFIIFGWTVPAGGGWGGWNYYVRQAPKRKREGEGGEGEKHRTPNKKKTPYTQKNKVAQTSGTVREVPADGYQQCRSSQIPADKSINDCNTDSVFSSLISEVQALRLEGQFQHGIAKIIRIHLIMRAASITRNNPNRKILHETLLNLFKDSYRRDVKTQKNFEAALDNYRLLRLMPRELHPDPQRSLYPLPLDEKKLITSELDQLFIHLRDINLDIEQKQMVKKEAEALYHRYRLVMSSASRSSLAIAWTRSLQTTLDNSKKLSSFERLDLLQSEILPMADLLGFKTNDAPRVAHKRVKAILSTTLEEVVTLIEENPPSLTYQQYSKVVWVIDAAKQTGLLDEHLACVLEKRIETTQTADRVYPDSLLTVTFTPVIEPYDDRLEPVTPLSLPEQPLSDLIRQIDHYLSQGAFGTALGLISEIFQQSKGAVSSNKSKRRLANQLRNAFWPLLYDLTLRVNNSGITSDNELRVREIRERLGILELMLTVEQKRGMQWLSHLFPEQAAPSWLEELEQKVEADKVSEALPMLKHPQMRSTRKKLTSNDQIRLKQVITIIYQQLYSTVIEHIQDIDNQNVDDYINWLGRWAAYITPHPQYEHDSTSLRERREIFRFYQGQLEKINTLINNRQWRAASELLTANETVPAEYQQRWADSLKRVNDEIERKHQDDLKASITMTSHALQELRKLIEYAQAFNWIDKETKEKPLLASNLQSLLNRYFHVLPPELQVQFNSGLYYALRALDEGITARGLNHQNWFNALYRLSTIWQLSINNQDNSSSEFIALFNSVQSRIYNGLTKLLNFYSVSTATRFLDQNADKLTQDPNVALYFSQFIEHKLGRKRVALALYKILSEKTVDAPVKKLCDWHINRISKNLE
ncbi:hypothetical protein [Endozoicomonas euniceicola]|uniref:Uncharacterized protein n=1 Tax=Endozoicomonas euniceicola TaxID=1234143 RepID=A0ABY6GRG2_9GAMM|nr:hypothetical protein [Endozoicomonas euniceicola]UYM15340.1 hypothetical protein NX720_21180 [Endozoicomonas euniceicola]